MTQGVNAGHSLRWQIALGQAAVAAAVLAVFALLLYFAAQRILYAELDRHLHRDAETVQQALAWDGQRFTWRETVHAEDDPFETDPFVEVWSSNGRRLFARGPRGTPADLRLPQGPGTLGYRSVPVADAVLRIGVERYPLPGFDGGVLLRVARSEAPLRAQLGALARSVAAAALIMALIAALLGAWLTARAVRPLSALVAAMQRVSGAPERELAARQAALHASTIRGAPREVAALATEFDTMLSRLSESYQQLDRFAADCAHELRTPLTALRLRGEQQWLALPEGVERAALGDILEQADRLSLLVNRLLLMARAGHAGAPAEAAAQPGLVLLREAAETMRPLADAEGRRIVVSGCDASVVADRLWLQQVLLDLLHNALRHAPDGDIELTLRAAPLRRVHLEVADRGPGVPPEVLGDLGLDAWPAASASCAAPARGTRIGLKVVCRLATAQGGRLLLLPREGGGTVARLELAGG